jgi:hypothetical protein
MTSCVTGVQEFDQFDRARDRADETILAMNEGTGGNDDAILGDACIAT